MHQVIGLMKQRVVKPDRIKPGTQKQVHSYVQLSVECNPVVHYWLSLFIFHCSEKLPKVHQNVQVHSPNILQNSGYCLDR